MFSFDAEYVDAAKFGAENKLDVPFLIPDENRILNDENSMWLTLASMEIIDFTFVPSYIVVNKIPTNEIWFDCGHWPEFSANRKHHPVVVGNDIVERLGLMGVAIGVF